ncbi:MAG: BBP7 family outer membrane beta-barrel protein [Planctomycetia bacterium]|nr:BBP7 family outer membrane beta-barrel protein [Planctomycetia bacterium]
MQSKLLAVVLFVLTTTSAARAQYDGGDLEYPVPTTFRYGGFWARDLGGRDRERVERCWARVEYLLWWEKDGPVPGPLVTTGPVAPTTAAVGNPGTTVLFGDDGLDYMAHTGGLFTVGCWFDANATVGLEISGLLVETHTIHSGLDSDLAGNPVIARPFFNVLTGAEDAQILTAPNAFFGTNDGFSDSLFGGIDVFSDSRFWGGEANLLADLGRGERGRLELIGGFRYFGLDESLRISQSTTVISAVLPNPVPAQFPGFLGDPVPPINIQSVLDRVDTRNEFYGGQLGLRGMLRAGRFSTEATGKLGLGATCQEVQLRGETELTGPAGRIGIVPEGLYVVGANNGTASRTRLSVISEVGLRCGVELTEGLTVHVGGMLLFWSDIARPGEQFNRNLNPQLVPSNVAFGTVTGPAEPARRFESSNFWAGGMNLGVTLRY